MHQGHAFGGFRIEERGESTVFVADCACGEALGVADAVFVPCPDCSGNVGRCPRCGSTGRVVDHSALRWRAFP